MNEAQKHPLDFGALKKGDVITREQLEVIIGAPEGSSKYSFGCLNLRNQIMRAKAVAGEPVTACVRKGEIHILADLSASSYNDRTFKSKLKGAYRSFRRILGVDSSGFTPEQARVHGRRCETQGRILQAVSNVTGRELPVTPYRRSLPKRLPNKKPE